jgi:hypothetical protein
MPYLNKLAKEIHNNAIEHCWWQEERTFGEIISLCHSELSEALEEYRNGHALTEIYYSSAPGMDAINYGAKPEGIPIELGDCIIRILDYFGHAEINWDAIRIYFMDGNNYKNFGDFISTCHALLSTAYQGHSDLMRLQALKTLVNEIIEFCISVNIDIYNAIQIKHDYNKTRSYRHGNKKI